MGHENNLERVVDNIGIVILRFCAEREGIEFHAAELREHVVARLPSTAPDSPSRVLREMRLKGLVDYVLVSRAQSLYRIVAVSRVAA